MCDTMVALPCCTEDGSVLFAKNSDREPNEPHIIVRVPGSRIKAGEKTWKASGTAVWNVFACMPEAG